ncbi:unnamed protein product [Discula destructiva]
MGLIRAKFPTAHHFTISLFGCQYHTPQPSETKRALITAFEALLLRPEAALHVEELSQNDSNPPTKIWMTYWASPQTFKAWWESPDVAAFWTALPSDDAGFWRETISLPATRAMHTAVTTARRDGFGHCSDSLVPLTGRVGYWGAYRSRLTKDHEEDRFASDLPAVPAPGRPLSSDGGRRIRPGRVRMAAFPDNLCFVVEGQDYSGMGTREQKYWRENFDPLVTRWVTNVMTGGPEKGLVNARACHDFKGAKQEQSKAAPPPADDIFPGLDHARQLQVLFWLDISYMEHIGKHDTTHVKLRREFLSAYGPGGEMEGGDLLLWVDLGVLKADEVDAEYVGCYDGTGFTALDGHPSFRSEMVETAKLPAFFDQPIESKPEEW